MCNQNALQAEYLFEYLFTNLFLCNSNDSFSKCNYMLFNETIKLS